MPVCLELISNILHFLAQAASALPLFIVALLVLYKKDSAVFFWLHRLLVLCLLASVLGLLAKFSEPFLVYANMQAQGISPRVPSLFEDALKPYILTGIVWCVGMGTIYATLAISRSKRQLLPGVIPMVLTSALLFFTTHVTVSWPFSGCPEGIGPFYMASLLLQQALHNYIAAFAPAGICALCFLRFYNSKNCPTPQTDEISNKLLRIGCIFTLVGIIPGCLVEWGRILAYIINPQVAGQVSLSVTKQICLTFCLCCFFLVARRSVSKTSALLVLGGVCYICWFNWQVLSKIVSHLFI